MENKSAIIAMSGGVDSTVAAYLMKNDGFSLVGMTLKLCDREIIAEDSCCSEADILDAQTAAQKLGIPHEVISHSGEFRDKVIKYFAESYACGSTPNPCVECNREIKFARLCEIAKEKGIPLVATGHYVIKEYSEKYGRYMLKKAADASKDQSYVLWRLSREQVDMSCFPLGELSKDAVRSIARDAGFSVCDKKDSQDICFIKDGSYAEFVEDFLGRKFPDGDFVSTDGKILGRHKGLIRYTTGQRKGLGLALPAPLYVKEKDFSNNRVILCPENELYGSEFFAGSLNFHAFEGEDIPEHFTAFVKTRYKQEEKTARCVYSRDTGKVKVMFGEPQRAITKGQSAVFYDGDGYLIGGGIIE